VGMMLMRILNSWVLRGLFWISVLTLQHFQFDPKYAILVGIAAGNGSSTVNMQPVASWH